MALNLSVPTGYSPGLNATHFQVTAFHVDMINQRISVELAGWIDNASKAAGYPSIVRTGACNKSWSWADFGDLTTMAGTAVVARAYELLVANPDWVGAQLVADV